MVNLNGYLVEDVGNQFFPALERLKYIESSLVLSSGAQFQDLGGERISRPEVIEYFSRLEKSYHFAMRTAFGSMFVALLAAIDLIRATQAANLIHPVIDFLLAFAAVCLAVVTMVSGSTSIGYLKKAVSEACRISIS